MEPSWKQRFERVVIAGAFRQMKDDDYEGLAGASDDALLWDGKGKRTLVVYMPSRKEMQVIVEYDDGADNKVWSRRVEKQSKAEAIAKQVDDQEEWYDFHKNYFKQINR